MVSIEWRGLMALTYSPQQVGELVSVPLIPLAGRLGFQLR